MHSLVLTTQDELNFNYGGRMRKNQLHDTILNPNKEKTQCLTLSCHPGVPLMQVSTKVFLPSHLIMSSSSKAWKPKPSASGTSLAVVHETSSTPLDVILQEIYTKTGRLKDTSQGTQVNTWEWHQTMDCKSSTSTWSQSPSSQSTHSKVHKRGIIGACLCICSLWTLNGLKRLEGRCNKEKERQIFDWAVATQRMQLEEEEGRRRSRIRVALDFPGFQEIS